MLTLCTCYLLLINNFVMPLSSLSFVNSRYVLAFWYYLEIMPDALSVVSIVNRCNRKKILSLRENCNPIKHPDNIYLFKVNDRNTRKRCEICSKLTIKTPERLQRRRYDVFIVKSEHFSYIFLKLTLSTLNK